MTMGLLIFVIVTSLLVVAVTVGIDVAVDYVGEKKRERAARKEEKARYEAWALHMLTLAGLHKNAHAVYRCERGSHSRERIR